eukprot:5318649-Lingulodinium_polyedra.AAC.1
MAVRYYLHPLPPRPSRYRHFGLPSTPRPIRRVDSGHAAFHWRGRYRGLTPLRYRLPEDGRQNLGAIIGALAHPPPKKRLHSAEPKTMHPTLADRQPGGPPNDN